MSQAKRAIESGRQSKDYLMGYVAGYVIEEVAGYNVFHIEESNGRKNYLHAETKVFKTKKSALEAISEMEFTKPRTRFVRAYVYSSHIPENAKGLKLLSECSSEELEKVEWIQ